MSKVKNINMLNIESIDKMPKVLKITALLLCILFEINAVIVPAKAEIIAIKDKINAALLTP